MTNAEKLQKTMDEASRLYEELPAWLKTATKASSASSASVQRTVRPGSEEQKRR
jgi:uncharacterized phage infection (PIP) family protein YhgE